MGGGAGPDVPLCAAAGALRRVQRGEAGQGVLVGVLWRLAASILRERGPVWWNSLCRYPSKDGGTGGPVGLKRHWLGSVRTLGCQGRDFNKCSALWLPEGSCACWLVLLCCLFAGG